MGKKSPKAPPAPDPYITAQAQGQANAEAARETARLNQINQIGPGGSVTYTGEVGSPDRTQVTTLDPVSQQAFDAQQQIARILSQYGQGVAGQVAAQPQFSMAGLPAGGQTQTATYGGPSPTAVNFGGTSQQQSINESGVPATMARTGVATPGGPTQQQMDLSGLTGYGTRTAGQGPAGPMTQGFTAPNMALADRTAMQGPAGPVTQSMAGAGNIQRGVNLTRDIADVGGPQRDLDFAMFGNPNIGRDQVQSALMERMNPQIQQDRAALETRLAQQGITMGSNAWNQEMERFDRGVNDARLAAVLNAGQEQSRLFGLGRDLGLFRNQAQGQAFDQATTRAGFGNTAELAAANFGNAAQQQQFGQNLTDAQFRAAEDARRISQGLDIGRFGASENERIASGSEARQAQMFGQGLAGAQFRAGEDQRRVAQGLDVGRFGASENERIAAGLNAQRAQQFGEAQQGAAFRAAEDQRAFQGNMGRAAFTAGENERLASGAQDANALAFQQALARAGFGQSENQRGFENAATAAELARQENTRLFGLGMDQARFNAAEDQRIFGNQNLIRDRALNEMLMARNQPMNELAALLQGSPALNMPNALSPGQYQIQPGDLQGQINQNYAAQMAAYQQANQNRNSLMGNLFSLGGSLGSAAIMASDRRLKRDIRHIGTRNGLPLYQWKYLFGSQTHTGHMADEVRAVRPDAVIEDANGYLSVDYGRLAA